MSHQMVVAGKNGPYAPLALFPLQINMFLTLNMSAERSRMARKQNLRTLDDDGSTEEVNADVSLCPLSN